MGAVGLAGLAVVGEYAPRVGFAGGAVVSQAVSGPRREGWTATLKRSAVHHGDEQYGRDEAYVGELEAAFAVVRDADDGNAERTRFCFLQIMPARYGIWIGGPTWHVGNAGEWGLGWSGGWGVGKLTQRFQVRLEIDATAWAGEDSADEFAVGLDVGLRGLVGATF